jgi:WhiB family redox-sensing transcriptional regulator
MKTCSKDGCDAEVRAYGLCITHYSQARKAGVLPLPAAPTVSLAEPNWSDANCKGMDTNMFFPEIGMGKANALSFHLRVKEAKAICKDCPVAVNCLQFALENDEQGIWAGTDYEERRRIRSRRRGVVAPLKAANQLRVVEASSEAVVKLQAALSAVGDEALPEWVAAAQLRINNPNKSLTELATMSNMSKDAYSGKLRRLMALYETSAK